MDFSSRIRNEIRGDLDLTNTGLETRSQESFEFYLRVCFFFLFFFLVKRTHVICS